MEKQIKWELQYKKSLTIKQIFFKFEWLLVLLLVGVIIVNSLISPHFLYAGNIITISRVFLDKSFIVFPMVMVILLGKIDISIGSIVALSSVIMGVSYNLGVPMPVSIVICLAVATICGLVNGILITKFKELSAVIITLGTMILFRGIAHIILENDSAGGFPAWFSFLGWGEVFGAPLILWCFIVCAVIFYIILHHTTFGRQLYAIGKNVDASYFSGVNVDKLVVIVYMLSGFMSGITALFLTSRMGSTRPNIAMGYELEVIALVALGGVSTTGGKGGMLGPIIAVFILGYIQFGLGLLNIPAQTLMMVVGIMLITTVTITKIKIKFR